MKANAFFGVGLRAFAPRTPALTAPTSASSTSQGDKGRVSGMALFIARHRRHWLIRAIARRCQAFLNSYNNLNYDISTNGETFLMKRVATFGIKTLFDVGANVGEWTAMAKTFAASAEVHAFEISTQTFNVLLKNVGAIEGVHCCNFGLSNEAGTVQIRYYETMPALTTITEYPHPFSFVVCDARVMTGDEYCSDNHIDHIDLLKIDVEGMEERVLSGFKGMLERRAIDFVQFEYGRVSILNRFLLRDFYRFFESSGYRVGKLLPNYIDFAPYELESEDFIGPNYVACRKDLQAGLQASPR